MYHVPGASQQYGFGAAMRPSPCQLRCGTRVSVCRKQAALTALCVRLDHFWILGARIGFLNWASCTTLCRTSRKLSASGASLSGQLSARVSYLCPVGFCGQTNMQCSSFNFLLYAGNSKAIKPTSTPASSPSKPSMPPRSSARARLS
jgi:hypothetical protein